MQTQYTTEQGQKYAKYLTTKSWDRKRRRTVRRAGGRCYACGRKRPLDAHHRTYDNLGHEKPGDLQALCRDCHEFVDEIVNAGLYEAADMIRKMHGKVKAMKWLTILAAVAVYLFIEYLLGPENRDLVTQQIFSAVSKIIARQ